MRRTREPVRTQSMLFTIFGDYVYMRNPGAEIWIGSLIKLLGALGFSEQAVRLALSRMCRKGWLKRTRFGVKSFYSLGARGLALMKESEKRIFPHFQCNRTWDGLWRLVIYSVPEKKKRARELLRKELAWRGYGALSNGIWISPYDYRPEIERTAREFGIESSVQFFTANYQGLIPSEELVRRCWDLDRVNERYRQFLEKYQPKYAELEQRLASQKLSPEESFVERVLIVHEYRKFPFVDPGLPAELNPAGWLGEKAAQLFEAYRQLLTSNAHLYFDAVNETRFASN